MGTGEPELNTCICGDRRRPGTHSTSWCVYELPITVGSPATGVSAEEEDLKARLDKAEGRILELEAEIEHLREIIRGLGGHVPER